MGWFKRLRDGIFELIFDGRYTELFDNLFSKDFLEFTDLKSYDCIEHKIPLLIISKSGGARMMESAFSLMQMAKTSARLTRLAKARVPYFSLMTDPTTGGVSASFAMLGDINFAEPGALIGFAGPRVIKETIKKDLPEGFQTSEFLLEHGFLDFIVDRKELRERITTLLHLFRPSKIAEV